MCTGRAIATGLFIALLQTVAFGAPPASSRWPVQVTVGQGTVVTVFQPQLEDFQGDQLSGRAAVSVQAPGQTDPTFGAIWITSRVSIDRVARTVLILDVNITQQKFPAAAPADQQALADAVRQVFVAHTTSLSLDQLLSMLEIVKQKEAVASQFEFTAPKIVFLDHPAVKVQYDGPPRLTQVPNSNLLRAINTPFFVVLDPTSKTYYLKGAGLWFAASDPLGPFENASVIPTPIIDLANSSGYQDPQQPLNQDQAMSVQIVTATEPTELICTDGASQLSPIPGTDLLYVTNTDSDVFLQLGAQQLYVLISGRWYTAATQDGPWTFVPPNQLPPDFARIPPDSDKANVLASVPGTQAAQDAVADTYIPQTAAVNRHDFEQPPIEYDGDPQFAPISGTNMEYAVNTDGSVLLVNGLYYCCYQGVWYVSNSAQGPWQICTIVPPEIYTIPPSCPDYPDTYCYIYGYTPDVAYCGYLPGYLGCYPFDGCVIYGTGWRYRPWLGHHYYPRPWTYGFNARYNWYAGHWGFDFALSWGGGRAWIGHAPGHVVHSGGAWFGFGGFRPVYAHDALHETNAQRETAFESNRRDVYGRSVYDYRRDVHAEPGLTPLHPVAAAPAQRPVTMQNDVFTDNQGNVYRRTLQGWEVRNEHQWQAAPTKPGAIRAAPPLPNEVQPLQEGRPSPQAGPVRGVPEERPAEAAPDYGRLNEEYRARASGENRAQTYEPVQRSSGGEERGGGGGGSRGGGGGGGGRR